MRNYMRQTLFVTSIILLTSFKTQDSAARKVHINDIGWTFEIPSSLKFTDSSFNAKGDIDPKHFQTTFGQFSLKVFSINNFHNGSLDAYLWNNEQDSIQWNEYFRKDASFYFQSFAKVPSYKLLDSTYSEEIINQKKFKRQYVRYYDKKDNDTINLFHYYLLRSGKSKCSFTLDISFAFADSNYGKKYFKLLKSSKFNDD